MAVKRPTLAQLHEVSRDLGMTLSDEDARSFLGLMEGSFAAYDAVDAMPDYVPPVKYPRTPGYRPEGAENRYNAWYVKTTVKGAPSGKLAGKTVALKDNICLAGVPMMNGASTLRGYVPDIDATVVTRILDAGGTIVGKAHCEYFCFSGGSHTGAAGPVHKPPPMGHPAGGSSSRPAALGAGRRADDERRLSLARVRARHRRHGGHADSRRGGHHRRQGALRILLLLRRQSHGRGGARSQSAPDGPLGRGIVLRLRGAGGGRRGRYGPRRRSGRVDQDTLLVLRHLR